MTLVFATARMLWNSRPLRALPLVRYSAATLMIKDIRKTECVRENRVEKEKIGKKKGKLVEKNVGWVFINIVVTKA